MYIYVYRHHMLFPMATWVVSDICCRTQHSGACPRSVWLRSCASSLETSREGSVWVKGKCIWNFNNVTKLGFRGHSHTSSKWKWLISHGLLKRECQKTFVSVWLVKIWKLESIFLIHISPIWKDAQLFSWYLKAILFTFSIQCLLMFFANFSVELRIISLLNSYWLFPH